MNQASIRPQPRIKRDIFKALIFFLLLLGLLLTACTPDENDTFIQGTWFYNDLHIQQQVGESYSQTYWSFDRGTYETYTCCFVEFRQFGRYDILESEGDRLVLELFNIDGKFNSERVPIAITINRQEDTIKLPGGGPFMRITP